MQLSLRFIPKRQLRLYKLSRIHAKKAHKQAMLCFIKNKGKTRIRS